MGRNILAAFAGVLCAMLVIGLCESLGHLLIPPPPGFDASNLPSLRENMPKLSMGSFLIVLAAWFLGSLAGGWVAARLARSVRAQKICAFLVGGLVFLSGAITLWLIPHPGWFVAAACVLPFVASWAGWRLAAR